MEKKISEKFKEFILKKIINLIFNIDPFIFVYPERKLGSLNKKNVLINIYFFAKSLNLRQNIKYVFYLFRLLFLDIAKLIYSPLILLIYIQILKEKNKREKKLLTLKGI